MSGIVNPGAHRGVQVVGIAGPVGAGKSTLVRALAAALGDTTTLQFDHFERMTERPIEEVMRWMRDGADLDQVPVPGLADALEALKAGRAATDPLTRAQLQPAACVLFETQFGRRHTASGREIDFLVWIDVPLDVALARKVRQLLRVATAGDAQGARAFLPWLEGYLDNYLGVVGELLRVQRETVAAGADLIVDGQAAPQEMALRVAQALVARRP
ncbi:MAG: uridine kinase [Betaproteobacteria bacterium]